MKPSIIRYLRTEQEVCLFLWRTIPRAMKEYRNSRTIRINCDNGRIVKFQPIVKSL